MSKANMLVILFLIQSEQIKWVRTTLVSNIDLCLRLPNWLKCIKLFKIKWNWSYLLITFLISFLMVLRRTMGLNILRELYNFLLGFRMIIDIKILKWEGQWPNSKHMSVMLMILFRYNLFLMMILRCFYNNLFGPEVNKLLYLVIELMNSSFKKGAQFDKYLLRISSNMSTLIYQFWAVLNNEWRASHRSLISKQGWLLYLIALTTSSLYLLI